MDQLYSNEQFIKRMTTHKARVALTISGLACTLMFWLEYSVGYFDKYLFDLITGFISGISGGSAYAEEISGLITDMIEYVYYLAIPFVLAMSAFKYLLKVSNNDGCLPHRAPQKPVLYLFGCLGMTYVVNLSVYLLFGDLLKRFESLPDELPVSPVGIVLYFVSMAVLPAIFEEWAFRGVIMKHLLPYGRTGAIIVSALLFGIMHISPQRVIFATSIGILLGICYDYTRSIKFTMLIHFANNFVSCLLSFVPEDNTVGLLLSDIYVYAVMIVAVIALVYYIKNGLGRKKVSFARPDHLGYKLKAGRFTLHSLLNAGAVCLLLTYGFFIYIIYFYN